MAVTRGQEQYEEVNNELRLKVVQIQTLETEMERRGKDVAARDAEIQRLQVSKVEQLVRRSDWRCSLIPRPFYTSGF